MTQPWDIFWESQKYSGKVALLSEDRETIAHGAPAARGSPTSTPRTPS